jgi:hypothetical protein
MNQAKGYVFVCRNNTQEECLERKLFGTTERYKRKVNGIREGDIIFQYNLDTGQLFGIFEARSECLENIVPIAWNGRFPYQVKIEWKKQYVPINAKEAGLYPKPIMNTVLTQNEVRRIIDAFEATIEPTNEEKNFRNAFPPKYRCDDGHMVRSISEMVIDNWLYNSDIVHAYERKVPIEENMYCDFYISKGNCYLEFWGLEDKEYGNRKTNKIKLYEKHNLKVIQLDSNDIKRLDDVLPEKLRKFNINTQ